MYINYLIRIPWKESIIILTFDPNISLPVCLRYVKLFSSTGKNPTVAPYSGHMLAIVALSAMESWATPGPKNSTNLPTTPIWRRCWKTSRNLWSGFQFSVVNNAHTHLPPLEFPLYITDQPFYEGWIFFPLLWLTVCVSNLLWKRMFMQLLLGCDGQLLSSDEKLQIEHTSSVMCVTLAHHVMACKWGNFSLAAIPYPEWLVCSALCLIDSPTSRQTWPACACTCKRKFSSDYTAHLPSYCPWFNSSQQYRYIVSCAHFHCSLIKHHGTLAKQVLSKAHTLKNSRKPSLGDRDTGPTFWREHGHLGTMGEQCCALNGLPMFVNKNE